MTMGESMTTRSRTLRFLVSVPCVVMLLGPTMSSADDAYCGPDGSIVWEVTFSEDGNELHEKNVSTLCANEPHFALDRVLTRHSP